MYAFDNSLLIGLFTFQYFRPRVCQAKQTEQTRDAKFPPKFKYRSDD